MNRKKLYKILDGIQQHREQGEILIREVKRIHPENCTPALYAELQKLCLQSVKCQLMLAESMEQSLTSLFEVANSYASGGIGQYDQKTIDQVADWIRFELDVMDPSYGKN
jgi:hypothetical protein